MEFLLKTVKSINFYLSDYVLIILLLGAGIFFTFATKFVQIRHFKSGIKIALGGVFSKTKTDGISSFQALATAVAAQIGIGNIVGASGAILIGGPGAVLWMWVVSFVGMATIYAEAVLAIETRQKAKDGTFKGGPVYYIRRAFGGRFGNFLASFFALASVIALGFTGAMVQSNAISTSLNSGFGTSPSFAGMILTVLSLFVFLGGAKRIFSLMEKLVPVMALFFFLGTVCILVCRIKFLPETFYMIFKYAFRPDAIIGGSLGVALKTAISQGIKRGLFSNEAGMGSTPHAHASANVKTPHEQGVVAMLGVFIDSFLGLTMTALVVISTLYAGNGPLSTKAVAGASEGIYASNMCQLAFSSILGAKAGGGFVAICLFLFGFSSIVSWNYFGRINAVWLWGRKASFPYTAVSLVFIALGSLLSSDFVWELTDMFNQLMVLPNLIALVALSGHVRCHALKKNLKKF